MRFTMSAVLLLSLACATKPRLPAATDSAGFQDQDVVELEQALKNGPKNTLPYLKSKLKVKGDDWVLAITHPLYLLGGGLLVGMLLAEAVSRLDRWLRLRDEYASAVLLGLVLMTIGLIEALRLPVTLCMLFAGIVLRNGAPRAWVFPRHFGSVGGVLVVMLFLVVGAQIKIEHLLTGGFLALVLIAARSLAKLCGILLLARPAGISWRQGLLLGLALSPAAGPVMVAAAEIGRIYPQLQGTMIPVAMSAAAIMELAGPVIVALCLKWSGERRD